ncbi:MAG: response regulator, partial [Armatimonadota bacterium]
IDMGALAPRQLERAVETQARLRGGRSGPEPFVLLVDDDVEVGALVRDVLEGAGYRVGVAQNEEEVLAAVLASDGVSPQLLVLDLGLPGNGGIELLATLRSNPSTQDMLVVVLTGHPEMESKIHARGLEISRFLVKPVPVRQLVEVVDQVVREAEPAKQAVRT